MPAESAVAVLKGIDDAFGASPRPQQFTVANGDPECMDHEATLQAHDRDSLRIEDFSEGFSPMVECLPPGLAYYFPTLVRFDEELVECHAIWRNALMA